MSERFINQHGLLDEKLLASKRFVVIGAGAIGSYFVTTLAKMGAQKITVYDNDTIEEHNISNQIYPLDYIGVEKTKALALMARQFGGAEIEIKGKWSPDEAVDGDIIVAAVDNMDVRKAIWDYYKDRPIEFYLEARMGAQVYRVYGIDVADDKAVALYETKLYPQSEAAPDRCGEKSIIYTVLQVSGQMLSQVKRYLMKEYRYTEVIYDCLNDELLRTATVDRPMEVIEAEEEVAA